MATGRDREGSRRPTSERQIAANKRNARRSTGPRSEEGKRRSARNALGPGYWARQIEPIENGPFAERGEDFWALVEEVIEGLGPRDTLEYMFAKRAAAAIVRLERSDRFEAALLRNAAEIDRITDSILPDPQTFADSRAAAQWLIDHLGCAFGHSAPDEVGFWEALAKGLRAYSPEPGAGIDGLWSLLEAPTTEEEWKQAAVAVAVRHWSNDIACARYFYGILRDLEAKADAALAARNAAVARDQLDASAGRIDRARTAAWTELFRSLKRFEELKARTL
jgi:hypothetical protein